MEQKGERYEMASGLLPWLSRHESGPELARLCTEGRCTLKSFHPSGLRMQLEIEPNGARQCSVYVDRAGYWTHDHGWSPNMEHAGIGALDA